MKKVVAIILIIIILVLIGITIFLTYTINQNSIEISNLKSNVEIYEKEKNEYKNKISNYEKEKNEYENTISNYEKEKNGYRNIISNLETKIEELGKQGINKEVSKYEVQELPQEIEFDNTTKGTDIIKYGNNYYVIVKLGARGSSGYSLRTENVEINGNDVKIYVKEIEPEKEMFYLTVITYPYTALKFDFKPNVNVIFN